MDVGCDSFLAQSFRDADCDVVVVEAPRRSHKTTVLQAYARELIDQGKKVLVMTMSEKVAEPWYKEFLEEVDTKKMWLCPPLVELRGCSPDVILCDDSEFLFYDTIPTVIAPLMQMNDKCRVVMVSSPNGDKGAHDKMNMLLQKLGKRAKYYSVSLEPEPVYAGQPCEDKHLRELGTEKPLSPQ